MGAPALTLYQPGVGAVSADGLNTFEQTCDTLADLRAFSGVSGLQVAVRGASSAGDGGGGVYYWELGSGFVDNGSTVIVPYGVPAGAWLLLSAWLSPTSFAGSLTAAQTRATAAATSFASSVNFIFLEGYYSVGDGGQAFYSKLATPPSPTLAGNFQSADGAWWALVGDDQAFEALGGSTTLPDNTTPMNNAIAWFGVRVRSGLIRLNGVTYTFKGTVTAPYDGISIQGVGINSVLYFNNGALDCITTGTDSTVTNWFSLSNCQVRGPSVIGSVTDPPKTGGRAFYANRVHFGFVSNVFFYAMYNGAEVYRINEFTIENSTFQNLEGAWGIYFHAGATNDLRADALTTNNVVVNGQNLSGVNTADGVWWDGAAYTFNGNQLTTLGCRYGMWVKNTAASTSFYPQYGEFNNFVSDNMTTHGILFDAGLAMQFSNSVITTTSSTSTNGLKINPDTGFSNTSRFQFVNCYIGNCGQEAAVVAAQDLQFVNCMFIDGGKAAFNTYDALVIDNNSYNVSVIGGKVHNNGESTNWRYAYRVEATTNAITIQNSSARYANTGSILWKSTDSLSSTRDIIPYTGNPTADSSFITPYNFTPSGGQVLTAAQMLGGLLNLGGAPGAVTINTPTAAAMVAGLSTPGYSTAITTKVTNTTGSVITMSAGTGVTFVGNIVSGTSFTMAANTTKIVTIQFTNLNIGSEAVTMWVS